MKEKSVTADEVIFIKSGYQYLKTGNLNVDDVNPPLIMLLSTIPLLFLDLTLEPQIPPGVQEFEYGFNFLFYNQNPDQTLFWARIPTLILSLMLAILVFKWAKDIYGSKAGLLALFFYVFNPTIISLSGLAVLDLGSTFLIMLSLYFFKKFLKNPKLSLLGVTSIIVGMAFCSKHTSLILIPTIIAILMIAILKKEIGLPDTNIWSKLIKSKERNQKIFWGISPVIFLVLVVLTINVVYKFNGTGVPLRDIPLVKEEAFKSHPLFSKILNPYTGWIPSPLPYPFLRSLGSTLSRTSITNQWPSFLNGRFSTEGWWYYFLFAFLIKTPIPFLLCLLYCAARISKIRHHDWFNELFLLAPAGTMFLLASTSSTQIGIRHVLIAYPLLFIFTSKIANIEVKQKTSIMTIGAILGLWSIFSSISISPHYLAYFNEFTGGPKNGHRYLIDSNLDWGQDVKGLVAFLDQKGIEKIKFGHWIGIDPRYASRFEELGCNSTTGQVAIQVNVLQGLTEAWGIVKPNCYEWLRKLQPVDRIGFSIFVYFLPTKT